MAKQSLGFLDYIENYKSENIDNFHITFGSRISSISNKSGSKGIMRSLGITSRREYGIFQNTYLDYFRLKLTS